MVVAVTAVAVLGLASPALAHTQVEIDNPQAGATNVTLKMTAEAESSKAGIVSVRVVLPEGIAPASVALATAPAGWTLTQSSDGYIVGGRALPVHTDAKLSVRIAQLPATATVLVFKTLVTYSNGQVDRWIEPPTAANPKPDQPAPVVTLKPAAVVPTSAAPSPSSAGPDGTPAASATTGGAATSPTRGGGSALPWVIGAVVLVLAAVGLALYRRRAAAKP
jgi:Domain of unkown function (DUF1775)